jgi:hypothetical protein
VHLDAQVQRGLQTEDVGTAGGRPVDRDRPDLGEALPYSTGDGRLRLRGETRRDERVVQPRAVQAHVIQQEAGLPTRRRQVAIPPARHRGRLPVERAGFVQVTEDQRGFRQRSLNPVGGIGRQILPGPRQADLADAGGEIPRSRVVVQEDRHRGGVDARVIGVVHPARPHRLLIALLVDRHRCTQVFPALLAVGRREPEVLVGACERAHGLAVGVPFRAEGGEHPVGLERVAAAGERDTLQLPQPDVLRPHVQSLLHGVVGQQRLPDVKEPLGIGYAASGGMRIDFVRGRPDVALIRLRITLGANVEAGLAYELQRLPGSRPTDPLLLFGNIRPGRGGMSRRCMVSAGQPLLERLQLGRLIRSGLSLVPGGGHPTDSKCGIPKYPSAAAGPASPGWVIPAESGRLDYSWTNSVR